MARPRAVFVVGTRPDAIKTAPVALEFLKFPDRVETVVVSTGQHQEMLQQALSAFGLRADVDLAAMRHGQSLSSLTSRLLTGLDESFDRLAPSMVFAQGDTTTTFVASLCSFYRRIPFAHIEAGLRTPTIDDPFPEEFNRRATGLVADLHFPPTPWAAENLAREGVPPERVFVTGNTGIDAVRLVSDRHRKTWYPEHSGRVVVLTTHRRENWGEPQARIAAASREVVERFEDVLLVVPQHKNPDVRATLAQSLASHDRIVLTEPPDYADFVKLMERASLILTDSGGVQEEAPTFGVPVLVLRETTERPEGVSAGTAKLVGTDRDVIVAEATRLLADKDEHAKMAHAVSPYGDGKAAPRVRYASLKRLGIDSPPEAMWA